MENTVTSIGTFILGIVLIAVGIGLIIVAILDFWRAMHKDNKEWSKALQGLVIGIVGGIFCAVGAPKVISWFQQNGQSIPKQ